MTVETWSQGGVAIGTRARQTRNQKVISAVNWPNGQRSVIVDLDGAGKMGIVSANFAMQDPNCAGLLPMKIACLATYDRAASTKATQRYADYMATQPAEV